VNEVFIAFPKTVTLDAIRQVLARRWTLDSELAQPSVELGPSKWAYVTEVDEDEVDDPLFLEDADRAVLDEVIGDYRIFAVRYASPSLGRDMARLIAESELAQRPMLVLKDRFVGPAEFLRTDTNDQ